MDFLSAAYMVLAEAGEPLRYEEIARRALSAGLITPSGKTPEATMGARLYTDVKKEDSRFEHVGQATFAMRRKSRTDEIARRVEEINQDTRRTIRKQLHEMPAERFETLIGELLVQIGFEESSVQVTSYGNDGGIDVRGVLNAGDVAEVNAAVQVKRWKRNVQTRTVRDVRGSLTTHEQGIIITTSDFSSGARREAQEIGKAPISLVDGGALVELMIKHSVGVVKARHEVITLDSEWWDEISGVEEIPQPAVAKEHEPAQIAIVFPLTVRAVNDPEIIAALLSARGDMLFDGKQYGSPSGAGKAASGWKSCNGWRYWQFQDTETHEWRFVDDLRG